jgi:hypothetical protein
MELFTLVVAVVELVVAQAVLVVQAVTVEAQTEALLNLPQGQQL